METSDQLQISRIQSLQEGQIGPCQSLRRVAPGPISYPAIFLPSAITRTDISAMLTPEPRRLPAAPTTTSLLGPERSRRPKIPFAPMEYHARMGPLKDVMSFVCDL